jgi:wobble nucleotide-excising tRNase
MIELIHIKNVASYDSQGIQLRELKEINFIYGANGSGKTTLSNFIYDETAIKFKDSLIKWKNDLPITILVYNKGFRERNFGRGKLNGIFTLGEATTDQIRVIEEKTEELKAISEDGIKKREILDKLKGNKEVLENTFRETTWTKIYKKYEKEFKEAFAGSLQKESFKNRLLQETTLNKEGLEPLETLRENAKIIFGQQPQLIQPLTQIFYARILEIESNDIWKTVIVGKADVNIAKLIQRLNINDWVNQGRSYIQNETCPFCQHQTITEDFQTQLEAFFDENYLNNIEILKKLKQEYTLLVQNLINELNAMEEIQKRLSSSQLNIDKFSAYLKTLISQNTANTAVPRQPPWPIRDNQVGR